MVFVRDKFATFEERFDIRLIKELWAFDGNRIAVRFAYEWHDDSPNWFRSYGNENWEFDENGAFTFCVNQRFTHQRIRAQISLAAWAPSR